MSHRKILSDYIHIEWNESNFDMERYDFIKMHT